MMVSIDFTYILIYMLMPIVGAFTALFFHEFVFMKTMGILNLDDIDELSNIDSMSNFDM